MEPVSEEPLPPAATLREARRLLDSGRAFAAHEVLEARWKASPEAERNLWQGLAQICVGLTHLARGNQAGGQRLLDRGCRRLSAYQSTSGPTYGLDLGQVLAFAGDRNDLAEGAAALARMLPG